MVQTRPTVTIDSLIPGKDLSRYSAKTITATPQRVKNSQPLMRRRILDILASDDMAFKAPARAETMNPINVSTHHISSGRNGRSYRR